MSRIELLKSVTVTRSPEPRACSSARAEQGGLAHLPRSFQKQDAVAPANGLVKGVVHRTHNVKMRFQRHGAPFLFEGGAGHRPVAFNRAHRVEKRSREFIDELLVVLRAFPQKILQRIKNAGHLVGQRSGKFHANGQQTRFAVLRLGRIVREFDLVGDHLAIDRVLREQRDHHVGLPNLARDLPRPFLPDRQMPIDKYIMAGRSELRLQPVQNDLIGLALSFVKDGDAQRRNGARGRLARRLRGLRRPHRIGLRQIAPKIPMRHIGKLLEALDGVLLGDLVRGMVRCAVARGLHPTNLIVHPPGHRQIALLEHAQHLNKKLLDALLPRRALYLQPLPEVAQQKLNHNPIVDAGGLRGPAHVLQ